MEGRLSSNKSGFLGSLFIVTSGTVYSGVEFGQNVCNGNTTCP